MTDTAGDFNTTSYPAPLGGMFIETAGQGIDAFGSGQGGFSPGLTSVSVPSANFTSVPPTSAELFSGISGQVVDGTGSGGSISASTTPGFVDVLAHPPGRDVQPVPVVVRHHRSVRATTRSSSPLPTNGSLNVSATAIGYRSLAFVANASAPAPGIAPVATAAMSHDGYLNATVVDATTLTPVPLASVSASVADPANGSAFSLGYYTNGSGEVNTTAPAGPSVSVTVSAAGYASRSFTVSITSGLASSLGRVALTEGAPPTGFFVQSEYVNTVGAPALPTAVDPKTGAPLPDAKIVVAAANGTIAGSTSTNDLGQFLVWVPATPFIALTLTLSAYDPVTFNFSTGGISHLALRYVNTTGAGIVSGRVVIQPNGTGLYNTLVNVCPYSSGFCDYVDEAVGYTNASGDFWVPATRGLDQVNVQTQQYLANVTPTVTVSTEGFYNIGTVDVYAFATISGVVLGCPGGPAGGRGQRQSLLDVRDPVRPLRQLHDHRPGRQLQFPRPPEHLRPGRDGAWLQ